MHSCVKKSTQTVGQAWKSTSNK